MTKKYSKCKKFVDIELFSKDKSSKDGRGHYCKRRASIIRRGHYKRNKNKILLRNKIWRQNNISKSKMFHKHRTDIRRKFLNQVKVEHGCYICNEHNLCCLDFHHVKKKNFWLTHKADSSYKKLLKEMSKCIVVCCNCHRKIHFGKIPKPTATINIDQYKYLTGHL